MTKPELMKKFEAAVDAYIRDESYGKIEVSFSKGRPHTLRKELTESLTGNGTGEPHHVNHKTS